MKKLYLVLLLLAASCTQKENSPLTLDNIEWIDLSYAFDSSTLYWPNNLTGFVHTTDAEGVTPLGYFYSSYSICTPEHGGTHLDAPIHFAKDRLTVDELPMTSLAGNAVVVDVSANAPKNRDYLVQISDIEAWEKENGPLEENTIVLFRTGYG